MRSTNSHLQECYFLSFQDIHLFINAHTGIESEDIKIMYVDYNKKRIKLLSQLFNLIYGKI
jgi:hypothetical protein